MQQWWYLEGQDRQGPFSPVEFEQLVAGGRIARQTLVWTAGMADWVRLVDLPGLAAESAAAFEGCPHLASRSSETSGSRRSLPSMGRVAVMAAALSVVVGASVALFSFGWIGQPIAATHTQERAVVWVNPVSEKRMTVPAGWQVVGSQNASGEKVYVFKHEHSSTQVLFGSDQSAAGLQPSDYAARLTQSLFENFRFEAPRYLGKIGDMDVFESLGGPGQSGAGDATAYFNVIGDGDTLWRTVALSAGEPVAALEGFRELRTMLLQSL